MNINSLLREVSGPRPSRRVMDIISKPGIRNRSARSLENQSIFRIMGGKDCDPVY